MRDWDPQQYLQFKHERTQPSKDLVAQIQIDAPETIIDIGCGPGNSTHILRMRWPKADIVGVDMSEKMIEKARTDYPGQKWIVADASTLETSQTYDIVFSNAAIQWISGHETLIPRLFQLVNKNGILAVQVPANHESPLYKIILKTSQSSKWSVFTASHEQKITYHSAEYYYNILNSLTRKIAIWETIYYHILKSHHELIEWYRGTGMRPFLDLLKTDENRTEFENDVLDVLKESKEYYPLQSDGSILYPFKRLFFTAHKSEDG